MLIDRLQPYIERAERAISEFLRGYRRSVFFEPIRYAMEGGKRVRAALVFVANEAAGGGGDPSDAAAAVEFIHTASLIHDDIIDRAGARRGRPPFHRRFGLEASILVADFLLSLVLRASSSYGGGGVADLLSRATAEMSQGEMEEVEILREGRPIGLERYLSIVEKKTASVFEAAAALGGVIAGADGETVGSLARYGRLVGTAYQLRDDLLDWGSEGEISSLVDLADPRAELEDLAARLVSEAKGALGVLAGGEARDLLEAIADFSVGRIA